MGNKSQEHRRNELNRDLLIEILDGLIALREETDPALGASSEKQKNYKAEQALWGAGFFVELLTSWAVNHVTGRLVHAGTGRDFSARDQDSHQHEPVGAGYELDDFMLARMVLARLISMGGVVPERLRQPLQGALQALNAGEVHPLLARAEKRRWWSPFSLAEIRLGAICHVHFLYGAKTKKKDAIEKVADAFGVSPETVRNWEQRWLPEIMGDVTGTYGVAGRAGSLSKLSDEAAEEQPRDLPANAMLQYLKANSIDELAVQHRRLLRSANESVGGPKVSD